MTRKTQVITWVLMSALLQSFVLAQETAQASTAGVMSISYDNLGIYWHTNRVSLSEVSNKLASMPGHIDAVALHPHSTASQPQPPPALLRLLARKAMPVLLVKEESDRPTPETRDPLAKVGFSLDAEKLEAIADLHNRLTGGNLSASNLPTVKTSFELTDGEEIYRFRKIELGLPGQNTWLMHERTGEEESTTGIQLKKKW